MKLLRKIGAILVVMAMICSLNAVAFAAADGNVLDGTGNESEIEIKSATASLAEGIYTVNLIYSFKTGTTVTEDTQITVLGYIFDTAGATAEATALVEGKIRAIDQTKLPTADNGTYAMTLKLAQGTEGYTVPENAKMVVKLGTDATVSKAQAFFIDLSNASESYAITFAAGVGATGTMAPVEAGKGYVMPQPTGFTHSDAENYVFAGWKIGDTDTVVAAGATYNFSADTVLTATWRALETYTITYAAGDHGTGTMADGSVKEGNKLALPANGFTADGDYKFVGWSIAGETGTFMVGAEYVFTANTTVTAVWEALETYTITYSAGTYGEGSVPEGTMADGTAVEGKAFTLPTNGFTVPDGYKFAGWKIESNGSVLKENSTFTFTGNDTVTAQWVVDDGETYYYGDLNGDTLVNGTDWMTLVNHVLGNQINADLQDATSWQYKAADLNSDSLLNGTDWMILVNDVLGNQNNDLVGTEFTH